MSSKSKQTPAPSAMETQIDDNLRRIFEEDAHEDVPAHLMALVAKLGEIDALASDNGAASATSEDQHGDASEDDR